jgi:hypothetical protein
MREPLDDMGGGSSPMLPPFQWDSLSLTQVSEAGAAGCTRGTCGGSGTSGSKV